MAIPSNPVSVGDTTKKSHYDTLYDNALLANTGGTVGGAQSIPGIKTWEDNAIFQETVTFSSTINVQDSAIFNDNADISGTLTVHDTATVERLTINSTGSQFYSPVSGENSLGTYHDIPHASRPLAWVLAAGNATSDTEVDFSSYVPTGTNALLLVYVLRFDGDGVLDSGTAYMKENGSSQTDVNRLTRLEIYNKNMAAGSTMGLGSDTIVKCDNNGKIEYYVNDSDVSLWLNIKGYWI